MCGNGKACLVWRCAALSASIGDLACFSAGHPRRPRWAWSEALPVVCAGGGGDCTNAQPTVQDQIRTTAVVLVLAGMYSSHREWIQAEIELANEFDKPIIGIRPHASDQTPNVVEDAAVEMVGWRQKSIVGAIVEHAV